jgi:peptidoglycan/LPS O-acetylase OafA/YrhL
MRGTPRAGPRGWLPSLQSLRGLAALWVVLYHLDLTRWAHGSSLLPVPGPRIGWLGVDLFFVLSAYLLGQPFLDGRARPYGRFLSDRFMRIAPAYYAAALLAAGVVLYFSPHSFKPANVAPSLLFLTNMNTTWYFALNPAFWSLAVEMQFYLLLPFMARLFVGRRWPFGLALCVAVAVVVRTVTFQWGGVQGPDFNPLKPSDLLFFGTFGMPSFLAHFGLGLAACRLRTVHWPGLAALAAVPLVLVPTWLWIGRDSIVFGFDSLPGQVLVRPIAAAGFALLLLAAATPGAVQRVLAVRPLRWLGDMSYSLYLVHIPVQFMVDTAVDGAHHATAFTLWGLAASLAAGAALYLAVEQPAERLRHQRKLRARVAAQAAAAPGS